jgi:hypothetical protein
VLVVLAQAAVAAEPGKRPLDHPATRQDGQPVDWRGLLVKRVRASSAAGV